MHLEATPSRMAVNWRSTFLSNLPGSSLSDTSFAAMHHAADHQTPEVHDARSSQLPVYARCDDQLPLNREMCDLINGLADEIIEGMELKVRYRGRTNEGRVAPVVELILDRVLPRLDGLLVDDRPTLRMTRLRYPGGRGAAQQTVTRPVHNLPAWRNPPAQDRQFLVFEDEEITPFNPPLRDEIVATGGESELVVKFVDQGQCVSRCVVEIQRLGADISRGVSHSVCAAAMLGDSEESDCVNGITTDSRHWFFTRVTANGIQISRRVDLTFAENGLPTRAINFGPGVGPDDGSLEAVLVWIIHNWK